MFLVQRRLFIMKLETNMHQGKLPSLEQGPTRYEITRERDSRYNQCIQFMKVILYLELIVLIGWVGCIFLANVHQINRPIKTNGPYKVSEWEQSQESPSLLTASEATPVGRLELSPVSDDTKAVVEKIESTTESVIGEKYYLAERETSTTTSVLENDAQDAEDAMVLSAWLRTLTGPRNVQQATPPTFNAFWNRIPNSMERNKDESETSEEKMTLVEDPNEASTTGNYFDTMHGQTTDFSDTNIDYSLPSLHWSDRGWLDDYTDEVTNSDTHPLLDSRFINWRFDFQFPDLVERHLPRQAMTSMEEERDSSSLLSEEMEQASREVKRSVESSSSSEEKTTPEKKVKRSADSSSSESDSSDSSSSESNDGTTKEEKKKTRTMKATRKAKNCPKILDDNGNTIDDPKDIADHIKRNWFKWLLDTPIPDCGEAKTAKTVTLDECGKFVVACTTDDSDETSEVTEESTPHHRDTRNVETSDADWDQCEKASNESRKNFDRFIMDLVTGEPSDPLVNQLRREFRLEIAPLIMQFFIDEVEGKSNKTDQEWLNSLVAVRDDIYENTNADHQRELDRNGRPTQEMATKLRDVAASVTSINRNCMNVLANSANPKLRSMVGKITMERFKCPNSYFKKEGMTSSLAADVVGGETVDPTVIHLRYVFKDMIRSLARELSSLEPYDSLDLPNGPVNITDEQWTTYMLDLKRKLANSTEDPAVRQRLETTVVPTQEQTNQLQSIMDYYLREVVRCRMMSIFGFVGSFKDLQRESNRRRRSAEADTESVPAKCQPQPDDAALRQERQVRLENYKNDVAKNESFRLPLLETIDAQVKAENPSKIIITDFLTDYASMLDFANNFIGNTTSSDFWREGYELLSDVIIELQKLDENDTVWKDPDMVVAAENFTSCLLSMSENFTSEVIFWAVVKAGESVNLRYSADTSEVECGDPDYRPVYGQFTYVGDKPDDSAVHGWKNIFNAIIKLYFKIYDPEALPHNQCSLVGGKSLTSSDDKSSGVRRSISESTIPRIG